MNTKDFLRLGAPLGEATRRATDFVAIFILGGGDKSQPHEEVAAIVLDLVEGLQRSKLTPTTAPNHQDFGIIDRQRLVMWQRRFYEQLDSVKEMLLPVVAEKGKPAHAAA
jgi:hypothetical protein